MVAHELRRSVVDRRSQRNSSILPGTLFPVICVIARHNCDHDRALHTQAQRAGCLPQIMPGGRDGIVDPDETKPDEMQNAPF